MSQPRVTVETSEERIKRLQQSLVFEGSGIIGWDDGEPIPLPQEISVSSLPENATMAHIMFACDRFKSIGEAKRNGWDKPIELGLIEFKKGKKPILVVE